MRLIDADALKFKNVAEVNGILTHILTAEEIDNAPTVKAYTFEEVESIRNEALDFARNSYKRPHGKWITTDKLREGFYICSNCKEMRSLYERGGNRWHRE